VRPGDPAFDRRARWKPFPESTDPEPSDIMNPILPSLAILALLPANAAVLIQESFDYAAGAVNGAATNATGLGGSWTAGAFASGATTAANFDSSSLSFAGHFANSGGSLVVTNAGPGWGEGGASATVSATLAGHSTLFSSSIMSFASPNSSFFNDWVVEQRFNTTATGTFSTSSGRNLVRAFGSGSGAAGKGGVGSNNSEVVQGTGTNAPGTNYLLVTSYTVSGGNVTGASLFAFDEAAYAGYLAAATPATAEALLGTHALYTLTDADSRSLADFTFLQFNTQGGPIGRYDDYRLGTSVTDVVNIVPEPSAAVVCVIGSLGAILRRSRRRA
jgi:hypothetical protein